jgi:uncharacterized protein involved in exopolysaccharide biosynthesis
MAEVSEKFIVKTDIEEADETGLIDYLKVLWKWKRLIIGGTLLCMIVAAVVSLMMPKVYRATALLLVVNPKIGGNEGVRLPPIETYIGIIKSQTIAKGVLEKFSLDKPPHNLTFENLINGMVSVTPIKGTNLIRIEVEYTDPEKARNIANAMAISAVELNKALNEDETIKSRDFLKTQLDEASQALAEAEQELLAFKETAGIAKLRKDIEILLEEKRRIEIGIGEGEKERADPGLLGIDRAIEEKNAVVEVLARRLENEKKILELSRSITDDAMMQEVIKETSNLPISALLGIQVKNEQVNPLHQALEPILVEARSNLEGLKAKKAILVADLGGVEKQLADLQKELAQKEMKLENLVRTYELNKEIYKSLKQRFDEARIQVASKTQELKVVDSAIIPENPIKPNKKMNVLTTGAVALLGLIILAFLLEYISSYYKVKPSLQATLDSSLP